MLANDIGGIRRSNIRGGIRSQTDASGIDPLAADFFARVTGAGGTLNATEIAAVSAYAAGLRADGVIDANMILRESLAVGDFASVKVPFIKTIGAALDTLTGFTSADYDRALGLQSNGAGVVKTGALGTDPPANSGGLFVYDRSNNISVGGNGHGATHTPEGQYFAILAPNTDTNLYSVFYAVDTSFVFAPITAPIGHVGGLREFVNANVAFQNGAVVGSPNFNPSSLTAPPSEITFFAVSDQSGGLSFVADCLLAEWAILGAASVALVGKWYTRLQALNTALGRQV